MSDLFHCATYCVIVRDMKPECVLIGLGNHGSQYSETRHNLGWIAIDYLAKKYEASAFSDVPKFVSETAEAIIQGKSCLLVKPHTYMNGSGEAVRKIKDFYKLDSNQFLILCDDIDIELGSYRLRMSGGAGTHNGLKSIVEAIGESFPRLRLGIGPQKEGVDLAAWVLSKITPEESARLSGVMAELPSIVATAIAEMQSQN